jgi:hypothetical protein
MAYLLRHMDMASLAEDIDNWTRIGQTGSANSQFVELARTVAADVQNPSQDLAPGLEIFARQQIPAYRCPSALDTGLTSWGTATASYGGNRGWDPGWGFFDHEGIVIRLAQVTDGLTYTIAVSEAGRQGRDPYQPNTSQQPQWIGSPQGPFLGYQACLRRMARTCRAGYRLGFPVHYRRYARAACPRRYACSIP